MLLGAGASAQTLDDLKKDGNGGSTDNVLTYGMGYHQQRYSPLKQINKQTVKRLVPVWNLSLDNNWGEQAQPIVYNGVMYVTNARATVAIDVAHRQADLEADARLAAGDPARGLLRRLEQGRRDLRRQDLPHHARRPRDRATTPRTGKELWKSKVAEWKDGVSMTLAPLIANGVLVTGNSGAEFGMRGFIDGWDTADRQAALAPATPSRPAARRATRPGRRTTMPGSSAAARPGSPAPTIPSST